jgi:NitT/TauT family transport system substrate-binding protein
VEKSQRRAVADLNKEFKLAIAIVIIVVIAIGGYVAVTYLAPANTTTSSSTHSSTSSSTSCCSINLVRIGYFANINHGQALIGLFNGDYQKALGSSVQIKTTLFSAGPTEMIALLAGQLDMAYVGPSPAVNAFVQSNGTGLRIVAGASSGGALFVVTNSSGIKDAAAGNVTGQLIHKTFLAPQLGNTQDVSLRSYLLKNHLVPGTNVTVQDTSNANIVTELVSNKADGAWVPQPYGSLILSEASAHLFLDERSLWPGGSFSTAELVVSTPFLTAHLDVVTRIVMADVNETLWMNAHLTQAAALMNKTISSPPPVGAGIGIATNVMQGSLATLTYTYDPLAASVQQQAENAFNLGFLGKIPPNLNGLFDLTILNQVLRQLGEPAIST